MSRQYPWLMLKQAVLWLGLLLCGYALWRARVLAGDAIGRISVMGWVCVGFLLTANWSLAVIAWRQYLLAYTGQDPGLRAAVRQLGLLLAGKYVPGGVFGFLARMYDLPDAPRQQLFWAGLVEQAVGVAMSLALGGALYLAATRQNLLWIYLAILLPLLAVASAWLLHRCAIWLPLLRRHAAASIVPVWRKLLLATVLQLAQLLFWVMLVTVLARELYGLGGYADLGLAGAFLLAVTAGILVVFMPGGIGVREVTFIGLASHWVGMAQAVFLTALLRILASLLDVFAGAVTAMIGAPGRTK